MLFFEQIAIMSLTLIYQIAVKALAILKYVPDLFSIGKAIYNVIKNDDDMETPTTAELLNKLKEGESSAKETFEEIQKAFSKVKE